MKSEQCALQISVEVQDESFYSDDLRFTIPRSSVTIYRNFTIM